ncbi:MAG: hypothetical protein ABF990_13270 [Acetobacter sp.]|uniref:hypothetical protein n=1 Tax=Acetobacter sp. TaxID=440 RepID=UPI0039EB7423
MTLAAMIAQLLALGMVVWGMGFLPALGVASAGAMLLDTSSSLPSSMATPLSETGAALAVLIAVLPPVFLGRYQPDLSRERPRGMVPFLALGLMVLLQFTTVRAGLAGFPAGLCMALAGLVAVACRQTLVWQWAGLLTCGEGVLLFAVQTRRADILGVAALACVVVLVSGGLCAHRTLLRRVAGAETRPPAAPRSGVAYPHGVAYPPAPQAHDEHAAQQGMPPPVPLASSGGDEPQTPLPAEPDVNDPAHPTAPDAADHNPDHDWPEATLPAGAAETGGPAPRPAAPPPSEPGWKNPDEEKPGEAAFGDEHGDEHHSGEHHEDAYEDEHRSGEHHGDERHGEDRRGGESERPETGGAAPPHDPWAGRGEHA